MLLSPLPITRPATCVGRGKPRLPGLVDDYLVENLAPRDNILATHRRLDRDIMISPRWMNMVTPKPIINENWNW
ncbi:MAG: hypothetical protein HQK55_15180 [Deltaproteobacteria bacterium]|nr:hypothetical protein [Deltaproteobacteria bacterium]